MACLDASRAHDKEPHKVISHDKSKILLFFFFFSLLGFWACVEATVMRLTAATWLFVARRRLPRAHRQTHTLVSFDMLRCKRQQRCQQQEEDFLPFLPACPPPSALPLFLHSSSHPFPTSSSSLLPMTFLFLPSLHHLCLPLLQSFHHFCFPSRQ